MEIEIKKDGIKTSPNGDSYIVTISDELKKEIAKAIINGFVDSPEFMRVLTIAMERKRGFEWEWYKENYMLLRSMERVRKD